MSVISNGKTENTDRTVIIDGKLPKSWTCPHCGKRQKLNEKDNEIFMEYMRFIRHCEKCGYLHSWELHLSEEFKRKIVAEIEKAILYGVK